jgi:hypothetical protein
MPPGIFFPPGHNFSGGDPGDSFQRQFDLLPHVDILTVLNFGIGRGIDFISLVRLSIFHDITSINDIGSSQALAATICLKTAAQKQSYPTQATKGLCDKSNPSGK